MLNPQKRGASAAGDADSVGGGGGGGGGGRGIGKRFSKLGSWRQSGGGSVDYKKNWYTQDFEKGQDGSTSFKIREADEDADADAEAEGED